MQTNSWAAVFFVFFSVPCQRKSQRWHQSRSGGKLQEKRWMWSDRRQQRSSAKPLRRLVSTRPGSRSAVRLCKPLRFVSGGGLVGGRIIIFCSLHAHPAGGLSQWTVSGPQSGAHGVPNKMPGDGFTIKSRIRNLLRSPSTRHKKNRRENLTGKVSQHCRAGLPDFTTDLLQQLLIQTAQETCRKGFKL